MEITKSFLRLYLFAVAVNQGLMTQEVRDGLEQYDQVMFECLIKARIEHLKTEAESPTAFFSPEFYSSGAATMREALDNLDYILSKAA
jgi:hypothetical protein